VKVDICDEGDFDPFLDFGYGKGCCFIDDSDSNDFTARFFKTVDLMNCFPNIPGIRLRHRLDGDGSISSNFYRANRNLTSLSAKNHNDALNSKFQNPNVK
jgi:hypothetical protein